GYGRLPLQLALSVLPMAMMLCHSGDRREFDAHLAWRHGENDADFSGARFEDTVGKEERCSYRREKSK
ncbi:hypothetical protein SB783_45390, partial [Paraburkholderia sp. SIMBA_009]